MTARLERRSFRAVGTICNVAITTGRADSAVAHRALAAALAEVDRCEAVLSRFDPSSDLCEVNRRAGEWVDVDERLASALRAAVAARAATDGRFDPTILPALAAAGYDRSYELLEQRPPQPAAGWRAGAAVEVDVNDARVRIGAGAAVDLGGIGKGFAAMRALGAMREAWPALPGAFVDLGGDLALAGSSPDGAWRIDVVDPRFSGRSAGQLHLTGGGVATSGRDVRRFGPRRSLHHLIDPQTGRPATAGPLAVTVVADDAVQAEAHATALALMSPEAATQHVASTPAISALYIPHEGVPVALGALPVARPRFVLEAA